MIVSPAWARLTAAFKLASGLPMVPGSNLGRAAQTGGVNVIRREQVPGLQGLERQPATSPSLPATLYGATARKKSKHTASPLPQYRVERN